MTLRAPETGRGKPGPFREVDGLRTDKPFWMLDRDSVFLNHGSFGSCPAPVLEFQRELRDRLERQPVQFLARDLEGLWDDARAELATFVGAAPDDLVFLSNATTGVNTVLRSYRWRAGDELLITNHEYNACRNAAVETAANAGARVVIAPVPFPLSSADAIAESVMGVVTPRTRLALIDHVTSQTGLVLPLEKLIPWFRDRGIATLIDGAHAPGMLSLNLNRLGATYYAGNAHKWLCAPKGSAFLWVERPSQATLRPLVISHGANSSRSDRSRFLLEFSRMGTTDPTAYLSIPEALRVLAERMPGGWPTLMERNHRLACYGREVLCEALEVSAPCPDSMLGAMAALPLPDSLAPVIGGPPVDPLAADPLQAELWAKHRIEVPIVPWPMGDSINPPRRLLRVSAQLYNSPEQYHFLANALRERATR